MTGFAEYDAYDALGLAELVRAGDVQPLELVEAAIERIERIDPEINAVVHKLYDRARQAAKTSLPDGPFKGVPYLLKDMILHEGTPVSFGNAFMRKAGFTPPESHEVVRRSEQAGLIVLGKTNACELGLIPSTEPVAFGPTANPWDLSVSPGGSSGGTAAAVAAGIVPMGHGNDGGGSIRIPASACGVFGLKPSRGRNPGTTSDLPGGIAVEHCLSRTVRDSAALLDATRGPLPGGRWWAPAPERPYLDEVAVDPQALKIAFATADFTGLTAHPDCVAAVRSTAALCEELGHHVEEASPDIDGERFDEAFAVLWTTMPAYFLKILAQEVTKRRWAAVASRLLGERRTLELVGRLAMRDWREPPFEPLTMRLDAIGERFTNADVWLAWSALQEASYALGRFLTRFDVLLTPVLGTPPVKTGWINGRLTTDELQERLRGYTGYTQICNVSGLPAMSVPLHWNDAGLPIGVHVVGRFGDEATLFRLAGQLERARPWRDRRPKL